MSRLLNESWIEGLPDPIVENLEALNRYVVTRICERIQKIGSIGAADAHRLKNAVEYAAGDLRAMEQEIARITKKNVKDIDALFEEVAAENLDFASVYFAARGMEPIAHYAQVAALESFVRAAKAQAMDGVTNISNTYMIGFKRGKAVIPLREYYMDYRFDPYTGQPLNTPRSVNNRTWIGSGYQSGGQVQSPAQYQQSQSGNAQPNQPGLIVRPVASFDEAKAVPTDFSGALTIMPDWAHGFIYAKALGDNGTPVFRAYRDVDLPAAPAAPQSPAEPARTVEYAPLEELERLQREVNSLREELAATKGPAKETAEKSAGKGSKA